MDLNYVELLREVGACFSVNNMLRAECYKQRMEKGLSFLEFNYMIMQSYDFYHLFQHYGCNMQFGGDDQWSNMLGGTELIRRKLGKDAHAMTITLLLNSEGKKMGKTQSGAVWLDPNKTSPYDFYQYWRNVGDADVLKCLRMLTFLPLEQIDEMDKWEGAQLNTAKEILAFELTQLVHGTEEAQKAQDAAKALFSTGGDKSNMPTTQLSAGDLTDGQITVVDLLVKCGLTPSKCEARRLIQQGGLELNGAKVTDTAAVVAASALEGEGATIKKGKKVFHRAVLAILLNLILPQVWSSAVELVNNMSTYMRGLDAFVQELINRFNLEGEGINEMLTAYQDFVQSLTDLAIDKVRTSLPQIWNLGVALGSGVVSALTAFIASIYMLSGKNRLVPQLKKLIYATVPKKKAAWFLEVCSQANRIFVGFINGKLIDSAIIGVLCFILNLILRIPYNILIAVIIGVTNVIPFFGPIIGAVPCIMILIIVDPWAALRFAVLVLALQQFDGNILGPKILGDSTGLSAIWVLVSIVVCGGLFGFPGMLLGVPTFAVLYTLVREWVNHRLQAKGIDGDGNPILSYAKAEEDTDPPV